MSMPGCQSIRYAIACMIAQAIASCSPATERAKTSPRLPQLMSWRQVMPWEQFRYDYCPQGGVRRGYAVQSQIFVHGHEDCSCHRSKHPDDVTWFLQHIDAVHGLYPLHHSQQSIVLAQLQEQLPSLRPGFVVRLSECLSYGEINVAWPKQLTANWGCLEFNLGFNHR